MLVNYKIYTLNDPDTNEVRYVGYTKNQLNSRFNQHIHDIKRSKSHKACWIKKLIRNGKKPIINLIEGNLNIEAALELEVFYINDFKLKGCKLTNSTTGGDSYFEFTQEVKDRISKTHKSKNRIGNKNARFIDLAGKKFGKLTVIKPCSYRNNHITWLCYCDCGNKSFSTVGSYLTTGGTESCGCSYTGINSASAKPVLQINKNTGEILSAFECIKDVGRLIGVTRWHIRRFIENIDSDGGGYAWREIERDEYSSYKQYHNISTNKYLTMRKIQVIATLSNGEEKIFESLSEAGDALSINRKTIASYIKSQKIHKSGIKFKNKI